MVFVNLRHTQLIVILGIALLLIVAFPVAAANISGLKYDDFNQNGHYDPIIDIDPDDQEVGLPGWNISVYNQSNGALVAYQLTDSQGNYLFTGLDEDSVYIVKEDLASHSDWYNSTPTEIIADFKNTTVYPNESLVDGAIASQILPGQNTAFAVRSLWGSNGNYHQDIEWNPFSSSIPSPLNSTRSSLNPHWLNNTEYDFILTYDPFAADPNATINYTVTGPLTRGVTTTTITGKANTSGSRLPIDEIDVYTRANTGASPTKVEVYGITLSTLSGSPFSIGNSSIAISSVAPAQTHLMLRADRILSAQINNGFILKGKQKFSYPIPTPTLSSAGFAVQINVGKNNRSPLDVLEEFGNYQHVGEIEGYKFNDENNNGIWDIALNESVLSGWTIQLTNSTPGFLQTAVTDDEGEVRILPAIWDIPCRGGPAGRIYPDPRDWWI